MREEEERKDGECTQKPEPQSNDMGNKKAQCVFGIGTFRLTCQND